jgi:hypothetical protein
MKRCTMEFDSSSLINDVPEEVLALYAEQLDLKSCALFSNVSRKTYKNCAHITKKKREYAFEMAFVNICEVLKEVHKTITSDVMQDRLLADILRKLIFVSASNILNTQGASSLAFDKCLTEYNRIYTQFENVDIDWLDFNRLLEDAQFEFRGYNIIGINVEQRQILDTFKSYLKSMYFSRDFTIHSYLSFIEYNIEVDYNGENYQLDIDYEDDNCDMWQFLVHDTYNKWLVETVKTDLHAEHDRLQIKAELGMLSWNSGDINTTKFLSKLIMHLMPKMFGIFRGSNHVRFEYWNETMELNWLLREVVNDMSNAHGFKEAIINAVHAVQDEFNMYMFSNITWNE